MKYINSYRNLFDEGICLFTDGYLTNGSGIRINLGNLDGDKLYISYDMQRSNNSISGTYLFRVYDIKNYVCFSNYTKGTPSLTLEDKNDSTVKALTIKNKDWYKVYEVYDFKLGKVDMYIDGEFFASTSNAKISTPTYIILNLPIYSNNPLNHVAVRNIIISDSEFDMNDEVIDMPIKVVSSEWDEDVERNVYYTDTPGKKIIFGTSFPLGYVINGGELLLSGLKKGKLSRLKINGLEYNIIPKETLKATVSDIRRIEIEGLEDE